MAENERKHHRLGVKMDFQTKAKISTSMIISKEQYPILWEKLYNNTLERLKLLQDAKEANESITRTYRP